MELATIFIYFSMAPISVVEHSGGDDVVSSLRSLIHFRAPTTTYANNKLKIVATDCCN